MAGRDRDGVERGDAQQVVVELVADPVRDAPERAGQILVAGQIPQTYAGLGENRIVDADDVVDTEQPNHRLSAWKASRWLTGSAGSNRAARR